MMNALAARETLYEIVDLVVVDEIGPWTTLETPFDTAVERGATFSRNGFEAANSAQTYARLQGDVLAAHP